MPVRGLTGRRDRARVGRLLLGCVRGEAWRRGSPQWYEARASAAAAGRGTFEALAAAAHFHGVAGYVSRVLSRLDGVDAGTLAHLAALQAGALRTHLRALGDLTLLGEALGGEGIPWLVVKGPVLAEAHGAPDLRAYSDLDVVVPAGAFAGALQALEAAGASVLARNWWHRLEVLTGEVPLVLPSGTELDLHWHVVSEQEVRRAFPLRMPALLAGAREVSTNGLAVRTLGAADGLVYVAMHTAMSGGNRLVWLKDLERVLDVDRPTAADVVQRAAEARLGLVTATMLDKAAATLGTPVPPGLPAALDSSVTWRRVAWLARRVSPPERAAPGGSIDRLVSRATRTDLRSSTAELVRRARRWGMHGGEGQAVRAVGDLSGDEASGRRAFLHAVERSGAA